MLKPPAGLLHPLVVDVGKCADLIDLLEALLGYCRQNAPELRRQLDTVAGLGQQAAWELRAATACQHLGEVHLSAAARKGLQAYFVPGREGEDGSPVVLRARALAEQVEHRFAPQLVPMLREEFAVRSSRLLEAGKLFPVAGCPNRVRWVGGPSDMTTRRDEQVPPLDHLGEFGLGPDDVDLEVELDVTLRGVPDPFPPGRPLRLAVGVLNDRPEDLTLTPDQPRPGCFVGVGPEDRARQFDRMVRVVKAADAHQIDALVFPELCTDEPAARELVAVFNQTAHLRIVVAGSYHIQEQNRWRNTSLAWVRGGRAPLLHHKVARFTLSAKYSPTKTNLDEGIELGGRVRVYHGKDWSATLLICMDFFSLQVQEALRVARPGLVFVPAYSKKCGLFRTHADVLASTNQTIVVVANGPILQPERVVGVFGVPRTYARPEEPDRSADGTTRGIGTASGPATSARLPTDPMALPLLCIFDVKSGAISLVPG